MDQIGKEIVKNIPNSMKKNNFLKRDASKNNMKDLKRDASKNNLKDLTTNDISPKNAGNISQTFNNTHIALTSSRTLNSQVLTQMKSDVQNRINSLKENIFLKRDAYENDLKDLTANNISSKNAGNISQTSNNTLVAFTKTFLIYLADEEKQILDNIFNYQREKKLVNASYTASITKLESFKQKYRSLYENSKMLNFSYYPIAVNSSW